MLIIQAQPIGFLQGPSAMSAEPAQGKCRPALQIRRYLQAIPETQVGPHTGHHGLYFQNILRHDTDRPPLRHGDAI